MKKISTYLILLCALLGWSNYSSAQSIINSSSKGTKDAIASNSNSALRHGSGNNQVQNLFDIQFNYNMSTQITGGALAGVVYTGTEFWISRFNQDSLFSVSPAGVLTLSFVIPGVGTTTSGVRGMTYDGTYIYAGDNTALIKKINPTTKTLVSSITSSAPFAVRGITWDSTANGGAGGFWVSNFGTGFYLLSMTGTVLDSIPFSSHGVAGAYGIAFDPYSTGGPYIWAFDQTGGTGASLIEISKATGLPTGIIHNTQTDIGSGSGLAGGVSITWRYAAKKTILGIQQNTQRLFGYELSDYVQAAIDASADSLLFTPPYTEVPAFEEAPFNWTVKASNMGANSINDFSTTFTLNDGTSNVFAPAASHNLNVASSATISNNFGPFTAINGAYTAQAVVTTVGQTDAITMNDTISYNMFITDTVMARDDGTPTGSLGIGNGSGGTLGQYFDLPNSAYITSVTYLCQAPSVGDSTNADIYSYSGSPLSVMASTPGHVFTANDSINGVVLTLPLVGGPLLVTPGSYFIGVNEHASNVTLATSSFNYQPNSAWVIFGSNAWAPIETYGFTRTFLLRMNMLNPNAVVEIANQKFGVYPNPASSELIIESFQGKPDFKAEVYDMVGNKLMETSSVAAAKTTIDVSKLSAGMYLVKTIVGDKFSTSKISIVR